MKYYVISEGELPVAVIFSNSLESEFYIKSKVESLSVIFEALRKKFSTVLVRRENKVVVKLADVIGNVDAQAEAIVDEICSGDRWSLTEKGKAENGRQSVNSIMSNYLS